MGTAMKVASKTKAAEEEQERLAKELADQSQRPKEKVVSVGDLVRMCNEAASKMGVDNDHKVLILNCGYALQQLVARIDQLEQQLNPKVVM